MIRRESKKGKWREKGEKKKQKRAKKACKKAKSHFVLFDPN